MFLCISGLLRSKYLYFNLKSSFVLLSSSIGNGGVAASDKILISLAITSKCPVSRFSLVAPALFSNLPTTAMQNSALSFSAFAYISLPHCDSSIFIFNKPYLSLKST